MSLERARAWENFITTPAGDRLLLLLVVPQRLQVLELGTAVVADLGLADLVCDHVEVVLTLGRQQHRPLALGFTQLAFKFLWQLMFPSAIIDWLTSFA